MARVFRVGLLAIVAGVVVGSAPVDARTRDNEQAICELSIIITDTIADKRMAVCTQLIARRDIPASDRAKAYNVRGYFKRFTKQDLIDALRDYNEAIRLAPKNPLYFTDRAEAYEAVGLYDLALKDYDEAIELDPSFSYFNARARFHMARGSYDLALRDYDDVVRLEPTQAWFVKERGDVFAAKGDYDSALRTYDDAITIQPKKVIEAYFARATTLSDKGEFDRAIEGFDTLMRLFPRGGPLYPHRIDMLAGRADAYLRKRDYDRALRDYDEAVKASPKIAWLRSGRGDVYRAKGDHDRALRDYDEGIRIPPGDSYIGYLDRGVLYYKKTQLDRAIADFDKAIELDKQKASAYRWRGAALAAKREIARAKADFEAVLRLPNERTRSGFVHVLAREGLAALDVPLMPPAPAVPVRPPAQQPALATVTAPPPPSLAAVSQLHRNSIAILVGNSKYDNTSPVPYAHNDVRAMKNYLLHTLGLREDNIHIYADLTSARMDSLFGDPLRGDGDLFDLLQDQPVSRRGDVFVFYSGHGVPDPDAARDEDRKAFLLPIDVRQDRLARQAYPVDRLHAVLDLVRNKLPPDRNVVLMLDACFSGLSLNAQIEPSGRREVSLFHFSRGSFATPMPAAPAGLVRLIASTGDQVAYWDDQKQLGLFTSLFLAAVTGAADGSDFGNGDGQVNGEELMNFLGSRVPAEARRRFSRPQRPTLEGLDRILWAPRLHTFAAP